MTTLGATSSTTTIGTAASSAATDFATAAQGATADAAVAKALYDANTILAATSDNTPAALTIGASTIVGRKASGNIVALTPAESQTILSVVPLVMQMGSGKVLLPRYFALTTMGMATDTVAAVPILIHGTHTISALSVNVTTAGTGSTVMRLGVFNNDPTTGKPGTLLVDAGTADATSTGIKTITGLSTAVTPGVYWVAVAAQTVTGSPFLSGGQRTLFPYDDSGLHSGPGVSYSSAAAGAFAGSYAFGGRSTVGPMVGVTV